MGTWTNDVYPTSEKPCQNIPPKQRISTCSCFPPRIAWQIVSYMHLTSQIFACNHGKLSESLCSRSGGTAFEWHVHCILMWNVICWEYGERDLQQHRPALALQCGHQQEPDAYSSQKRNAALPKVQLQKQQTKQKIQASMSIWLSLVTWLFTEWKAYSLQKKTRAEKRSRR